MFTLFDFPGSPPPPPSFLSLTPCLSASFLLSLPPSPQLLIILFRLDSMFYWVPQGIFVLKNKTKQDWRKIQDWLHLCICTREPPNNSACVLWSNSSSLLGKIISSGILISHHYSSEILISHHYSSWILIIHHYSSWIVIIHHYSSWILSIIKQMGLMDIFHDTNVFTL